MNRVVGSTHVSHLCRGAILPNFYRFMSAAYRQPSGMVVLAENEKEYVTWVSYSGRAQDMEHGHYFPKADPDARRKANKSMLDRV